MKAAAHLSHKSALRHVCYWTCCTGQHLLRVAPLAGNRPQGGDSTQASDPAAEGAERRPDASRENVNNMPATSRETETEAAAAGADRQRERGDPASHNVVSVISQLADDHLTIVRNISTGLAIAGVLIIARSIKLITKFQAASEIPARFIERNVSLRGKVHSVTEKGLEVEHIPIHLPLLSPLLHKYKGASRSPLLVRLAGVELTPEGKDWLQKNLAPAQTVWLKLISREDDILHCLVSQSRQGSLWSYCVNEEVLKLGLARRGPIAVRPDSRLHWRLHKRLHRAEVKAERKGRGFWKEGSLWERASKAGRDSALLRLMRRIFKRT
ncbi:protein C3orf33 homolog isoform X3 [Hippoglossus hippoglossus]|uniref:protein C3orf33 homolog isoform X3 n=1 Tax=Hippoglossus hippoglossus TaxID=8267 RepID=UPI00148CBA01|nr:protein C3orf33 homolog isoform X3 [Hippoglossus hippoglossus]